MKEYFGDDIEEAKRYDCTEVIKTFKGRMPNGLIDFGTHDEKR